jgi:hypothetical protein
MLERPPSTGMTLAIFRGIVAFQHSPTREHAQFRVQDMRLPHTGERALVIVEMARPYDPESLCREDKRDGRDGDTKA